MPSCIIVVAKNRQPVGGTTCGSIPPGVLDEVAALERILHIVGGERQTRRRWGTITGVVQGSIDLDQSIAGIVIATGTSKSRAVVVNAS